MSDTGHFERFAEECTRLAQKQVYPRDRKALLLMAEAWLLLAENAFSSTEHREKPPPAAHSIGQHAVPASSPRDERHRLTAFGLVFGIGERGAQLSANSSRSSYDRAPTPPRAEV